MTTTTATTTTTTTVAVTVTAKGTVPHFVTKIPQPDFQQVLVGLLAVF